MALVRVEAILFLEDTSTSDGGTMTSTTFDARWAGPDNGYYAALIQFKVLGLLSKIRKPIIKTGVSYDYP